LAAASKTASDENFPVGSWLIPAALRPAVRAYYAFARTADDIADAPALPATEMRRLGELEAALSLGSPGPAVEPALRLRGMLLERGIPLRHGLDLLCAFRQDVVQDRYSDWAELMAYCDRSAAPVGRFLLDLHGEDAALHPQADALCRALQVINNLQDLRSDYRKLGRVYVPGNWLAAEAVAPSDLDAGRLSPGLRRVVDRCLDAVEAELAAARPLVPGLVRTGLALEAGAIRFLALDLVRQLRRHDPLAVRVARSRPVLLALVAVGAVRTALDRARPQRMSR
jgi:squalene synthase HpnC